jgi:hypothetical protein
MSNKGNAYVVASSLYARDTALPMEDLENALYHTIDVLGFGSDERKADLYAQLADTQFADTQFADAVSIIEAAMDSTDARHPQ